MCRPHRTECLKTTDNNREPKTLILLAKSVCGVQVAAGW
jgi:hypothetical protein